MAEGEEVTGGREEEEEGEGRRARARVRAWPLTAPERTFLSQVYAHARARTHAVSPAVRQGHAPLFSAAETEGKSGRRQATESRKGQT